MKRSAAAAPNVGDMFILDLELQEKQLTEEIERFQKEYDRQKVKLDATPPSRKKGMEGRALAQIGARKRKVEDELRKVQLQVERAYASYDVSELKEQLDVLERRASWYSYDRR